MAIFDWGSPASIGAFVIVTAIAVISVVRWVCLKYIKKHPFNLEYSYKAGSISEPTDTEIRSGKANSSIPQGWVNSKQKLRVEHRENDQHLLYLELHPRRSWSIHGIALRFNGPDKNKPSFVTICDINHQSINLEKEKVKRDHEIGLWYTPELQSHKGRALDYLVRFSTTGEWTGLITPTLHILDETSHQISPISLGVEN